MGIEIREHGPECLEEYATLSIAFRVESVLRVEEVDRGLGGLLLHEEPVETPYLRDYQQDEEEAVSRWARRFDLSHWGFFLAREGDTLAGGAAVASNSPELFMLDGRTDLACLWDLRVQPDYRGRGVGKALFARVVDWARARACTQLKIETTNTNVPACRFYVARGCHLGAIVQHAYQEPKARDEVALYWYLDL